MNEFGYLKVRAAAPKLSPADVDYNISEIQMAVEKGVEDGVDILVMPELGITGYTCGDLFLQPLMIKKAESAVAHLVDFTRQFPLLIAVGCPVMAFGRRYNCGIAIANGKLLGIVPKTHIPNYGEFYEKRWFESGKGIAGQEIRFAGETVPFGTDLLFGYKGTKIGIEICEDLWVPEPPSGKMVLGGAEIILNLSASDELIGKHDYLLRLISQQSARCRCVYAYASAGWGESSTDLVFSGNAIIGDDGKITESKTRFTMGGSLVTKDVDIEKLRLDRAKYNSFFDDSDLGCNYRLISTNQELVEATDDLAIYPDPHPFVPSDQERLREHCEEIFNIQAYGLMKRLESINCRKAVIGISGGLDSTLALLVTVRAFDALSLPRKGIIGITMPGLATTSRTKNNAHALMEELGVTVLEIPIGEAVAVHFKDIGQNPENYDVTFENSQARERTQILMDIANKENAIVIGTGDMSELALGWCTYNGDHMSMYGVNASVPKTLVRHLVEWFASVSASKTANILKDIAATPISPELVPSGSDEISQKTEDLVGPYELHDFFLYYMLRYAFTPKKIHWLAAKAFTGKYDEETILKWLKNFYRRFFNQQFKRSCMPDGPKVGSVCLSPRGDWRMPSDASAAIWLKEIDAIQLGIDVN